MDLKNFFKADEEKRKTVINAGFKCFGQNGYNKASMADIANEAAVSKASLFKYFGNKKDMYLYLYDFAGKEIRGRLEEQSEDFFECAKTYVQALADTSYDYPNLFDFLVLQSHRRDFIDLKELSDVADEACRSNFDILYANVEWNRFREELDCEKVMTLFNCLSGGFISMFASKMTMQEVYKNMMDYIDVLKAIMYKPEYLEH